MANGSGHEGPARADRYREKYAKMFRRTQRKLDAVPIHRELPMYRETADSNSEITVGYGEKLKVGATGIPGKALGAALVILAVAAAIVAIVQALG